MLVYSEGGERRVETKGRRGGEGGSDKPRRGPRTAHFDYATCMSSACIRVQCDAAASRCSLHHGCEFHSDQEFANEEHFPAIRRALDEQKAPSCRDKRAKNPRESTGLNLTIAAPVASIGNAWIREPHRLSRS